MHSRQRETPDVKGLRIRQHTSAYVSIRQHDVRRTPDVKGLSKPVRRLAVYDAEVDCLSALSLLVCHLLHCHAKHLPKKKTPGRFAKALVRLD